MWKSKLNLWLTPGHSCNSLPEIKKLQIQIESLCHSNFLALIVHKMFFKSTWVFFYLGEIQRLAIALISSPLYWKNPKIKGWGEKPKTSSIFFFLLWWKHLWKSSAWHQRHPAFFFVSFPFQAMFLMRDQSRGEIASHVSNSVAHRNALWADISQSDPFLHTLLHNLFSNFKWNYRFIVSAR